MSDTPEEQERILLLGEQIKQLFAFCGMMIPDLDLLERVADQTNSSYSYAQALFPVMGAVGMNAHEAELETKIHAERAAALLNLVKVLKSTEQERLEFQRRHVDSATAQAGISKALGL